MGMRKGFGGLLVLSTFMLGFVLLLSSHTPRIASKGYSSIVAAEVHSDRIAIARNIITKSYRMVEERNRAQWASLVESELSSRYGLRVSINFKNFPAEVNLIDPSNGMSASFVLT
jgi:hypothetical protein